MSVKDRVALFTCDCCGFAAPVDDSKAKFLSIEIPQTGTLQLCRVNGCHKLLTNVKTFLQGDIAAHVAAIVAGVIPPHQ